MKNFSSWPPNYRFGYLCAWASLVVGLCLVLWAVLGAGQALDGVLGALVMATGGLLVVRMPQWALDNEGEQTARRRARQARQEIKRQRRS